MNERTLQVGDLVEAVFRPDSIGVVERVYGDGGEIVDVRRLQQPSWCGAPARAFMPVHPCAQLYAVGAAAEGGIQVQRVVRDVAGLEVWLNHTPAKEAVEAYICRLDHHLQRTSEWRAVADLLAEESARALGSIIL